jgi:hypothetical protein
MKRKKKKNRSPTNGLFTEIYHEAQQKHQTNHLNNNNMWIQQDPSSQHTHTHTLSSPHNLAMPNKNDDDDSTLPFCKNHVKPRGPRKTSLYYANPNPSVPIVIAVNNAERNCSYDSYSGKSIWLKQV